MEKINVSGVFFVCHLPTSKLHEVLEVDGKPCAEYVHLQEL